MSDSPSGRDDRTTPGDLESPGDPFVFKNRLGDFELRRELGRGGMGVVYDAVQVSLKRRVALKVLPPGLGLNEKMVVRFEREARAAAKLHHPNIVAVHATGRDAGCHYYAMDLVEGLPLSRVMDEMREGGASSLFEAAHRRESTAPHSDPASHSGASVSQTDSHSGRKWFVTVARLLAEVADALDYAHQSGVIHRDIKPHNLMLSNEGRLCLTDFGLALVAQEPSLTLSGSLMGSPAYMSPEQVGAGRTKLDHRTDIYSLGAVMYQMLTSFRPFEGKTREEVLTGILTKEPKRPRRINPRVPVDLETICLKAMEKDPDRRYPDAGEMARDLRQYLGGGVIAARRAGVLRRFGKFAARNKVAVVSAAVILGLAVVSAGLLWKIRSEREQRAALEIAAESERLVTRAQASYAEGAYDEALAPVTRALELNPELLEARLLHARLLANTNRAAEAIQELERLTGDPSAGGAAHYLLAQLYQNLDRNKAQEHRRIAESLLEETAEAYHLRATTAGTFGETMRLLNEALRLDPRHYPSLRSRALVSNVHKHYDSMLRDAETMILLRPQDALGYTLRAVALRETGQLDAALVDHDRSVALAPDDPQTYEARRETHERRGNLDLALADARRCVELRPDDMASRFLLLHTLFVLGNYNDMDAEREKILTFDHGDVEFQEWIVREVFAALDAGRRLGLPASTADSPTLSALQRTSDYYRELRARAARVVPWGFRGTWSPDGRNIAYTRALPGAFGVEILNLDTGEAHLVVVPGKDPAWSPDGRYIAFAREPQSRPATALEVSLDVSDVWTEMRLDLPSEEVWVVTPEGTGLRRLATGGYPSWSADPRLLYFQDREQMALCSIAVDDPEAIPRTIVPTWYYPAISPDGRRVAYTYRGLLHVIDVATGLPVVSWPGPWGAGAANWSPNGREISVGTFGLTSFGLWILELDGGRLSRIFPGPVALGQWSPDGSRLAVDVRGPYWDIWVSALTPGRPTARSFAQGLQPEQALPDMERAAVEADDFVYLAGTYLFGPEGLRDPARALRMAETAVARGSDNALALTLLGVAYDRAGRLDEAAAALTRAAEQETEGPDPLRLFALSLTRARSGDVERARLSYREGVEASRARRLPDPIAAQLREQADELLAGAGHGPA